MKQVSFTVKRGSETFRNPASVFMNQENLRKHGWLLIFGMNEDSHPERNEAELSTVAERERRRASNTCRGERGPIRGQGD